MRAARETFSLRSLKVRIALAGAMLILASVTLTVIFVLREVGRSSEQIVLDSQEDDARRIAATVSQRLVGLQRALRSVAMQLTPAALGEAPKLTEFIQGQGVLSTLFASVFIVSLNGKIVLVSDENGARDPDRTSATATTSSTRCRAPADHRPRLGVAGLARADRHPTMPGVRRQRQQASRRCSAGRCACRAARSSPT